MNLEQSPMESNADAVRTTAASFYREREAISNLGSPTEDWRIAEWARSRGITPSQIEAAIAEALRDTPIRAGEKSEKKTPLVTSPDIVPQQIMHDLVGTELYKVAQTLGLLNERTPNLDAQLNPLVERALQEGITLEEIAYRLASLANNPPTAQ